MTFESLWIRIRVTTTHTNGSRTIKHFHASAPSLRAAVCYNEGFDREEFDYCIDRKLDGWSAEGHKVVYINPTNGNRVCYTRVKKMVRK